MTRLTSPQSSFRNPWYTTRQQSSISNMYYAPMVLPCAQSKKYATANKTSATTAPIENKNQAKKRSIKPMPMQEYVSYTVEFMRNDLKRCEFSLSLPITQTTTRHTTAKVDKETSYNKTPEHDDDLRDALDKFQRRYRLKSYVELIALVNGDKSTNLDIDLNWRNKALSRTNKSDQTRKHYLNTLIVN